MNWGMVLGAGLLAGATTCAATQGGLLVGLIARQKRAAGASVTRGDARLVDDLTPVGGFLVGKLISHTAIGFVLGLVGTLIGFNPRIGALAQWVAGLLMITLGLGSLGVPGFRELQFTPPTAWLDVVRRSTRASSAAAPFMLGLATLLVPCGVTISMEVLAASSGSPMTGAAVMALFVIGTAPMFTLFGFVSQRVNLGRALSYGLGAVVVVLGGVTINAGLVAAGSPYSFQALTSASQASSTVAKSALPAVTDGKPQVITIAATSSAYVPSEVTARAGAPIKLVFTTDNVWSCIRATMLPTLDKSIILPQTGEGVIDVDALQPGDYPISCSMGMYTATLHVV